MKFLNPPLVVNLQCPKQRNGMDCGIYAIEYLNLIFENLKAKKEWTNFDAMFETEYMSFRRMEWRKVIKDLTPNYHSQKRISNKMRHQSSINNDGAVTSLEIIDETNQQGWSGVRQPQPSSSFENRPDFVIPQKKGRYN
jgi:hypothetical protein